MINFWQLLIYLCVSYVFFLFLRFYFKNRKTEYEFTSIINHTFRTPLTRINWIVKELEDLNLTREQRLNYTQNINNATTKLLEIIDLITGLKNIKNTKFFYSKETSFRDIVEKSIEKYREEINKKHISFKVSTFNEIPFLILDINKISFVIDTLIENSIFYTPDKGGVIIDCVHQKNKILFYVADTGIGLTFYDKLKIFSRFYRNEKAKKSYPDGMGLRLYFSKQIIKRHRGKIYARSKGLNKGSVFFVELPVK